MTPAQCRAARGLLNWTQDDLAKPSGVSVVTVRNFENEKSGSQRASVAAIERALESAGVIFTPENGDGPGVKLRKAK
jgi:transcriptional regulator with XRE-family HTH domain